MNMIRRSSIDSSFATERIYAIVVFDMFFSIWLYTSASRIRH